MKKTFISLGKKKLHRPSKRELLRAADDIKLYRCDRFTIAVLKNLVQKTKGDQFTGCFSVQRMAKSWGISTRSLEISLNLLQSDDLISVRRDCTQGSDVFWVSPERIMHLARGVEDCKLVETERECIDSFKTWFVRNDALRHDWCADLLVAVFRVLSFKVGSAAAALKFLEGVLSAEKLSRSCRK